jgi:hypothetical protein
MGSANKSCYWNPYKGAYQAVLRHLVIPLCIGQLVGQASWLLPRF